MQLWCVSAQFRHATEHEQTPSRQLRQQFPRHRSFAGTLAQTLPPAVWLDQIARSLTEGGELVGEGAADGVACGETRTNGVVVAVGMTATV